MSAAGRVNGHGGVVGAGCAEFSQVSVIVIEVPASAVPSIAGAVLLVTGMLPPVHADRRTAAWWA